VEANERFLDFAKLAEQIFLLLEYVGEDYERKTYTFGPAPDYNRSQWLNVKPTLQLDFPNLPYYIEGKMHFSQSCLTLFNEGDVKITQTMTIMRYISRKHDLEGRSEEEKWQADMISSQILDVRKGFATLIMDPNFVRKNFPSSSTTV